MSSVNSTMASDATADPFTQSFTLVMGDGTPFNVSMPDLDDFILYNMQVSILYASQLGASLVILVVMAILTKPEKRFAPINILNALALVINFIRNVLFCVHYTGPFTEIYTFFGQDYSRLPRSAYANSIAAAVLTLVNLICIEGSLWLQLHVICLTLRKVYRQAILGISLIVASLAIVVRLVLCIDNAKAILSLEPDTSFAWLATASNVTTTISVFWFCAVFVIKLGFALHQRRKLGLRRFGPMQIIFIIGCQTMIIPTIFSILEYTIDLSSMDSNVITLVAIFLPLSSLWAASSTDGRPHPTPELQIQRRDFATHVKPKPSYGSVSGKGSLSPSTTDGARTTNTLSPKHSKDPYAFDEILDLEAQNEKNVQEV